jgi:hypothetical protein
MAELAIGGDTAAPVKHSKLKTELIKLFWTFLYLFLLFGMLVLFRTVTLKEHGISDIKYGMAAINALIFAKVILIGDWMKVGTKSDSQPLLYSVLAKSAAFAALFIVFHFLEDGIIGLFHGKTVADMASADAQEMKVAMVASVIFFVTLLPFFFFREVTRELGSARVRTLLFEQGGLAKLLDKQAA